MRLKKLNTNRRHKAGEDEASGADSEPQNWVSPSKAARVDLGGSSSGASSPTDPSSVQQAHQQHLGEHSPLQFQTHSAEHASRGAGLQIMDNSTAKRADWRGAVSHTVREAVVGHIVEVLQQLKPNAPQKVLDRLPGLARHMEEALLKTAVSVDEYGDVATLSQRIARIQESNAKRLLAQQQGVSSPAPQGNGVAAKPLPEEQARLVFQFLQTWRQKLVTMYGVAPWEILPNQTLAKVALYMPATEQELVVCGVHEEQVARFGSSLIQELQRLRGAAPASSKPATRQNKAKGRKSESKRSSDAAAGGSNKKRKNSGATNAAVLAPAVPSPTLNSTPLMSPSQMIFRSQAALPDTLPTLLASTSLAAAGVANNLSNSSTPVRLSPAPSVMQPFFSRMQPQQQQGSPSQPQENHMHLLAQGAGQLSKQQDVKSVEAYEQEVRSLRWMLEQSQQEKLLLQNEVRQLRAQLQGGGNK